MEKVKAEKPYEDGVSKASKATSKGRYSTKAEVLS